MVGDSDIVVVQQHIGCMFTFSSKKLLVPCGLVGCMGLIFIRKILGILYDLVHLTTNLNAKQHYQKLQPKKLAKKSANIHLKKCLQKFNTISFIKVIIIPWFLHYIVLYHSGVL